MLRILFFDTGKLRGMSARSQDPGAHEIPTSVVSNVLGALRGDRRAHGRLAKTHRDWLAGLEPWQREGLLSWLTERQGE